MAMINNINTFSTPTKFINTNIYAYMLRDLTFGDILVLMQEGNVGINVGLY